MNPTEGAELLARCGIALHGEYWLSPLARDLGVTLRTMQRWASGSHPVNPRVWGELLGLVETRGADIAVVVEILKRVKDN